MKFLSAGKIKLFIIFLMFGAYFLPSVAAQEIKDLVLRAEPASFSPNGDGIADQIFFYPVLNAKGDIHRWRLEIQALKLTARLNGAGLPALIKWDGLDRKGRPAPDGAYTATLQVWGEKFKLASSTKIRIDRKGPQIILSISTPAVNSDYLENYPLVFIPKVLDDSPIELWQLQVLNPKGGTVALFWSTGPVTGVEWDGRDRISKVWATKGVYRGVFHAWDLAGNEGTPATIDFNIDIAPREMLASALKSVRYHTTPLGLIVPLPSDRLFHINRGKPEFQEVAGELLRDVAILINAYPDAPVLIEGYARSSQGRANLPLASAFAWKVYSYLVKEGGVPASRLHVRGRGLAASPARLAMDVLVLRHGVEVILEGNGQW